MTHGEHVSQLAPGPGPGRRFVVSIFALLLGAAGIAFAVGVLRSGTAPIADESPAYETSPGPSLTGEPRITAEIQLLDPGDDSVVGGITVGAGSAWVGLPRAETASLVRIDIATNVIAAEIPLQAATWRKRIVATEDAVWVASSGLLERIDPATNTVVARVVLPDRSISAIAADDAAVWASRSPMMVVNTEGSSSGSTPRRTRSRPRFRSVPKWQATRTK